MTNLLNVLKTMETETAGVKNDVINFLLAQSQDSEDAKGILENVLTHGCESGMVNHLIYYKDTVRYFEEHKEEITEMLYQLGIEDVESWDGLQELSNMFPLLETPNDRHENAENEIMEKAENIAMYEYEPMQLNTQDKNYLSWAIFEYEAVNLENELNEMGLIK